MLIDFRRNVKTPDPVIIDGAEVERTCIYTYLGTRLDNKLRFCENVDFIIKKANSRMYCLRKLRSFDVNSNLLSIFYNASVLSILSFGIVCWGGGISVHEKGRLEKIVKKASRIIGENQLSIQNLYDRRLTDKVRQILSDTTHPLYNYFENERIDRSGRLRTPRTNTNRYKTSFIPRAISVYNSEFYQRN